MKMRIAVTVNISQEQFDALLKIATMAGENFDDASPQKIVRRHLEGRVKDEAAHCLEDPALSEWEDYK